VSAESFTNDFSAMQALKSLGASGKGKVAVILPDTTSSTRYVEFDAPDLHKAFVAAGVPSSDIIIQNAQKSDQTFLSDAQSDITNGATVILSDPEDSGTGAQVEKLAAAHGVKVIDYDRLTLGGSRPYYVSFNNVNVGKVMGQGLVGCLASEHVAKPQVIVMRGDPTDNNATLFYQGYYDDVLAPLVKSGKITVVAQPAGTWTPPVAETEFQQALTAHTNANAALIPNDENGAPIITYLKSHGIKAKTFPTTGQDATLTGLQNIISGYQCGTVYKAVYKEAGAAVALAIYLRDKKAAPAGLLNGVVTDVTNHKKVKSVLLPPVWVTTANMKATIIKDNFVTAKQLCAGAYKADCTKYGI
jgi:D-xylose transport system substrate-binding protein